MKFDVGLKHIKMGVRVGDLIKTEYNYGCHTCWYPTGWRRIVDESLPGIPCCSDECLDLQVESLLPVAETSSAPDLQRNSSGEEPEDRTNDREKGTESSDHR